MKGQPLRVQSVTCFPGSRLAAFGSALLFKVVRTVVGEECLEHISRTVERSSRIIRLNEAFR
jgi:hypothetical protein